MGIGEFFKSLIEGGKVDVASRYEILREAVSGTMSNFHMARDRQTEQIVGLKILDKEKTERWRCASAASTSPPKARSPSLFNHPRIVTHARHGITTNGEQFVVMEYLDGPGLNSLIIGRSKLLDGNRLTLMHAGGRSAADGARRRASSTATSARATSSARRTRRRSS